MSDSTAERTGLTLAPRRMTARERPGMEVEPDDSRVNLLHYLPDIYRQDPFMPRFLRIFESILDPLDRQIEQLHYYFDPRMTPSDFLPWLGTWVDLVLDENWPEARRRELIRRASDLYRRRGTRDALCDYLAVYLGVTPEIIEDGSDENPFHFIVRFQVKDPGRIDVDRVRRIIEQEKPAHTIYTLQVEQA